MVKIEFHDLFIYWYLDSGEPIAKVKIWFGEDFLRKELKKTGKVI